MSPPKTAYILLWFPEPSETFIFKEVVNLRAMGLPLLIFTLYGRPKSGLSQEMRSYGGDVERLGIPYLKSGYPDLIHWWKKDRKKVFRLLKAIIVKRWYGLEKTGENLWAFFCAFRLARRFEDQGIEHIHAPWANGPATAAWIASHLTGIPFSFTARAWDIYPADGVLREKIRDAALVRSETRHNIQHLSHFTNGNMNKIYLTYNGVPLRSREEAPVLMSPPYRLLALGRFVGKKGYDYLIKACRILKDSGLHFHLTLAGSGPKGAQLKRLTRKLGLAQCISFPGFITYDRVSDLFRSTDLFLMPSIVHSSGDRDGIPTVIMEALLHRVPVIATDVSGISELIENHITGLLIPQKNPSAIAGAVIQLLRNRQTALDMAERGRSRVLELFNPEINHRKVFELYQRLPNLAQKTARPVILDDPSGGVL